jgi:aminoglycoside phosphotransferase (APT) family kinase protein
MEKHLTEKIEAIIGEINTDELLLEQGWTSKVRKLTTPNGEFLLKSSFEARYREWLKTEAEVLQKLKNEDIPVPSYFGYMEEDSSSHLIMSFEKGNTLTAALKNAASRTEKLSLLRSFGQFLQQFHEREPVTALQHDKDWLEKQLEMGQLYLNRGEADGDQVLLDHLKVNKPDPVQQTMIHGDCTTDNVLVVNGEVRFFIDVAGMTVGDPRYDEALAIRKIINHPEYLDAFYEGYTRYRVSREEFTYFEDGLYAFF